MHTCEEGGFFVVASLVRKDGQFSSICTAYFHILQLQPLSRKFTLSFTPLRVRNHTPGGVGNP